MNAREKILANIALATSGLDKNPAAFNYSRIKDVYSMQDFESSLLQAGGLFTKLNSLDMLSGYIQHKNLNTNDIKNIVSLVDGVDGSYSAFTQESLVANDCLNNIDLVVMRGEFGVKENGAVWVNCEQLPHPALPFITKHLIVVLENCEFVDNMYAAYQKIVDMPSYGLFITGPSKTADIERCTVIGAHGPISLDVIMI